MACWLPLVEGLTPHGLRHGHATWLAEDRIDEKLRDVRMGHVSSGMRTHYTKITDEMRRQLRAALEARWERSLAERAAISTGLSRASFGPAPRSVQRGHQKAHIPNVSQTIRKPPPDDLRRGHVTWVDGTGFEPVTLRL
ncbi:tyrosine-type recombinase/integrase [Nonomuraea sp. NPDC050663]|uniref:tyrosine-type recombinase/integrase n=1 Tax=Nonomuraea sp. NPDC050663 TaxID=3364370 RepID=UPI0037B39E3D